MSVGQFCLPSVSHSLWTADRRCRGGIPKICEASIRNGCEHPWGAKRGERTDSAGELIQFARLNTNCSNSFWMTLGDPQAFHLTRRSRCRMARSIPANMPSGPSVALIVTSGCNLLSSHPVSEIATTGHFGERWRISSTSSSAVWFESEYEISATSKLLVLIASRASCLDSGKSTLKLAAWST